MVVSAVQVHVCLCIYIYCLSTVTAYAYVEIYVCLCVHCIAPDIQNQMPWENIQDGLDLRWSTVACLWHEPCNRLEREAKAQSVGRKRIRFLPSCQGLSDLWKNSDWISLQGESLTSLLTFLFFFLWWHLWILLQIMSTVYLNAFSYSLTGRWFQCRAWQGWQNENNLSLIRKGQGDRTQQSCKMENSC